MILETIHTREDLLKLSHEEDVQLCAEIREFLVGHVAQTGGHLASNLGIVETTLAVHKVFDTSSDRLVFDV
ncbi:MAG: 1-deoxy-D-xylulose-5-phosphate synthase, partial [Oscillospiraceae bacterium]|nr:1-deoxy-D-xylulose-5-phosphate synthase [Oscillospiraceae bacterium]